MHTKEEEEEWNKEKEKQREVSGIQEPTYLQLHHRSISQRRK